MVRAREGVRKKRTSWLAGALSRHGLLLIARYRAVLLHLPDHAGKGGQQILMPFVQIDVRIGPLHHPGGVDAGIARVLAV